MKINQERKRTAGCNTYLWREKPQFNVSRATGTFVKSKRAPCWRGTVTHYFRVFFTSEVSKRVKSVSTEKIIKKIIICELEMNPLTWSESILIPEFTKCQIIGNWNWPRIFFFRKMAFLWDWFTGVLKGLGLMNKSGEIYNFTSFEFWTRVPIWHLMHTPD